MKKSLMIFAILTISNAYGATRWSQPDNEKPRQAFDYFIGGDDETTYVQLSPQAKDTLKRMLDNTQEDDVLDDVIDRVSGHIRTTEGQEALDALYEMADNDPELPAGVVKDGMFGGGEMLKKAREQRQNK